MLFKLENQNKMNKKFSYFSKNAISRKQQKVNIGSIKKSITKYKIIMCLKKRELLKLQYECIQEKRKNPTAFK